MLRNSVPDVASGVYVMAFGDFRIGYSIVDRTGMSVVRLSTRPSPAHARPPGNPASSVAEDTGSPAAVAAADTA
jgi:hypothetical protein